MRCTHIVDKKETIFDIFPRPHGSLCLGTCSVGVVKRCWWPSTAHKHNNNITVPNYTFTNFHPAVYFRQWPAHIVPLTLDMNHGVCIFCNTQMFKFGAASFWRLPCKFRILILFDAQCIAPVFCAMFWPFLFAE